ncbi:acyltransferase family protein [Proteus mirabilis]|uniref:acyltransferase n=2 Tax=Proteus TaxID=583 RepID=UPI00257854AE|nr:acyltransferase family protein [Proteus mirabilis]MDM3745030.1 acyltransferase family protein [Proteus mirabilis]
MEKRVNYIDYIRAFACIMVVLIHTSAPYVNNKNIIGELSWEFANIIDALSRPAVPLFFMMSGYFFLNEKNIKMKNIIKIFSSLIFYSLIAWVILYINGTPYEKLTFIAKPAYYHLWFFYTLIPIYLIISVIKVRELKTTHVIFVFFVLFFLLNSNAISIYKEINVNIVNKFMVNGIFIMYFLYTILGGCLRNTKIKDTLINKILLISIFIISSLLVAYLTHSLSLTSNKVNTIMYSYVNPLVFISALSLFLFMMLISSKLKDNIIIKTISKYSLGIYGIHAFVIFYINKYLSFNNNSVIYIPIYFTLTMLISIIVSCMIKK